MIGSHVARLLVEGGHTVVCLQRPSSDTTFLESLGCHIVPGDVRDDPEDLARAADGCGRAVHAAALVYPDASWPRIRLVNVDGTRRVVEGARRAGLTRIVHVSSVAVHGAGADGGGQNLYARSKREAEQIAFGLARDHGLELCALRPSGVYGERDRILSPRLAAVLRWPVTPLPGSGDVPLPLVYAGNVAGAVLRALESPAVEAGSPRAWDLGEDEPLGLRSVYRHLARGLGVRVRPMPVPEAVVRAAAHLLDAPGRRGFGAASAPPAGRIARFLVEGNPYDSDRARKELEWEPAVPASEALERTGRWMRRTERSGIADRRRPERTKRIP